VGGRSANAAAALSRMGFTKTMNLVGGMVAWNAAGKTIEK
jgi:rhodanese-related sulfurtransferase